MGRETERWTDRWIATTRMSQRKEKDTEEARERERAEGRDEWERGGERGSERVERCTTTKYDDAAVGTRLTPSKNDRRCLPCFLRASQFPTSLSLFLSLPLAPLSFSSWPFLAAGISRCRSLRPAPNSRRGYARHSRAIVASIQGAR